MRRLLILISFLIIFLIPDVYAQKNFVQGYIVTINQDTLRGWINYQDRDKSPTYIEFRQQQGGNTQVHDLAKISSMMADDDYFVSKTVDMEMSPHRLQHLNFNSVPEMIKATVLLRVLVRGIANLYYVKDNRGKEHFLIEKDTVLEELIYKQYKTKVTGKSTVADVNTFKGQLSYYFQDCPEVKNKLPMLKYQQSDMTHIFEEYNRCIGVEDMMVKQKEKLILEFRAIVGASLSSITFESEISKTLPGLDFSPAWNPAAGVSLNIIVPNNRQRWSFCNDLLHTHYKVEATKIPTNTGYIDRSTYYFDVSYLKLFTMARFQYPGTHIRPFFNAGWTNALAIRSDRGALREYTLNGITKVYKTQILNDFRKYEQGWTAGGGLLINRFLAEARYERANGMSEYETLRSKVYRWYFLLGYHF